MKLEYTLTHLLQQALFLQPLNSSLAKLATLCLMCPCERRSETHSPSWEVSRSFQHATYHQCRNDGNSPNSKKKQKSREIPPKKNRAWKWKMNPQEQKIPFRNHHSWAPGLFFWGGIHPRARRRRTVAWFLHQSHSKSCRIVCCDFVFQGVIKYYLYPNNALCSIEITPNRHTFACVWIPPQQKNRVTL